MRLIDADALEKEGWSLHRTIRVDKNTEEYQTKRLRQVPTIEPEPHWIPCSERLPEKTGWYAVIDDSGGAKFVETSYYREEDGLNPFWEFVNPVAWMPLPEPYKEGE